LSYIGRKPTVGNFQICDAISVVNGQAAYTMQVGSVNVLPETANHMIVSLNGVIQKPNSSYTIAGAVITFSSNLVTGDVINFIQILGSVLDVGTVSDATITNAKTNFVSTSSAAGLQIKGDGTTDGTLQLNCSQNSHGIKIKSPPHSASASYTLTMPNNDGDANQFLQTNGSGVLSFAAAGGTNTPRVSVDKTGSSQSVSSGSWTKVTLNTERVDSDNAFTSNTFTVPSGEGGDYYMSAFAMITDLNGTSDYASLRLANSGNSTVYNGTANAGNSGYGWVTMAISCIRTLSAGDTVSLWIYGSEAIGVNEDNANLSVIKLI
jgi:hypothetical protein